MSSTRSSAAEGFPEDCAMRTASRKARTRWAWLVSPWARMRSRSGSPSVGERLHRVAQERLRPLGVDPLEQRVRGERFDERAGLGVLHLSVRGGHQHHHLGVEPLQRLAERLVQRPPCSTTSTISRHLVLGDAERRLEGLEQPELRSRGPLIGEGDRGGQPEGEHAGSGGRAAAPAAAEGWTPGLDWEARRFTLFSTRALSSSGLVPSNSGRSMHPPQQGLDRRLGDGSRRPSPPAASPRPGQRCGRPAVVASVSAFMLRRAPSAARWRGP